MTRRSFHCYAYGRPGDVEAICVDLDIAVQGKSITEVRSMLNEAIASYVEDALAEPPEVAKALLSRRAPWHVRTRLALLTNWLRLKSRFSGRQDKDAADFDILCHA